MNDLAPIAANAAIALTLTGLALLLRGDSIHSPRHRAGHVDKVPAGWTPYDGRVRSAFRHYATRRREVIA